MDSSLNKEANNDTDKFTKGLESSRCASILYDCFKNFEPKVSEVTRLSPSIKYIKIKGPEWLEEVSEFIKFINKKFEEIKVNQKRKEKIVVSTSVT